MTACRPAPATELGGDARAPVTARALCDARTRETLQTRLAALADGGGRIQAASFDDPGLRALLRVPCLTAVGGRLLAEADAESLQAWWHRNDPWLRREVLRGVDEPLRWLTLPSAVRASVTAVAADDPVLAALVGERGPTCSPTTHWMAEAERLFELEAYDRGQWHHRPPVPRLTADGYPETSLGEDCLARLGGGTGTPALAQWRECLLRTRDRRALSPVGSLCSPTRGSIELSVMRMPGAGGVSCEQRVVLDLTDGASVRSGSCGEPLAAPIHVPVEAVRRAAFFAVLRPHVVVGADSPETIEIPVRLGGGEIELVSVAASILPPYGPEPGRPSHQQGVRYRVNTMAGQIDGSCVERTWAEYGQAAVCSAMNDLWALAGAP